MRTSFVPCCPSCNLFFLFVWGYGRKRPPRRCQQVVDPSVGPLFRFRAVSRVGLDSGRYSSVIRSVSGGEGHKATECPALLGQLLRGPSGGHVMVLWETCAVVFLLVAQHCRAYSLYLSPYGHKKPQNSSRFYWELCSVTSRTEVKQDCLLTERFRFSLIK